VGNVKRRMLGLGLVIACNLLVGGLGAAGASAASPGTLSRTTYLKWTNTCSSPEGGAAAKVKGRLSATITPAGGQWQVVVVFIAPPLKRGQTGWYGGGSRSITWASPRAGYYVSLPLDFTYQEGETGGQSNAVRYMTVVKATTAGVPTSVTVTKVVSSACD
jgi:hypothetical protein